MLTFEIYDYADSPKAIVIPDKSVEDIHELFVNIISGDEIITIKFKNNESCTFDSCSKRTDDYEDGFYVLSTPEKISQFINFDFSKVDREFETKAYTRLDAFTPSYRFAEKEGI